MCLLVVRPMGSDWLPSQNEFENAWDSNPHGLGIAYARKGKLHIKKTLQRAEAQRIIREIPKGAPALIHWRFATHGSESVSNCHPFHLAGVRSKYWVGAHNGVLSHQSCLGDKTDSESYLLGLERVDKGAIERDIARLGYGKIALLSAGGEVVIANESQGHWRDGTWRSNSGMDDSPFWASRSFGKRSNRLSTLQRLTCDYCDDAPLWESESRELLCDSCASLVEGGIQW